MAQPRPHFRTIGLIIGATLFMDMLDGTVLATALPTMARDLGTSAPAMSIALTSYLISLAIFIPVSGRIADRFGARSVLRAAIVAFTLGSIACAQAPNLPLLVLARFFQGIGGAMMVPVGRIVLMRNVEKRQLFAAMSWVLIPAVLGPVIGPPLGGFFVTYLDWRWIFYINVPVGAIGVILVSLFIPEVHGDDPKVPDTKGTILSGLSLGSLLFGCELFSHDGALGPALALLALGTGTGLIYLRHATRVPDPILDFRLMRVPSYGTAIIAGAITRVTQGAQPYLLPLMMQLGFGLTALQSGAIVLATALGSFAMKWVAPHILRRFGYRDTLVVNGFFSCFGYMMCALFRPGFPYPAMFLVLLASGFFMSFQFSAYNTLAYDRIPPGQLSAATSLYTTFQQLMLSLGICVGAAALEASMAVRGHGTPQLVDFQSAFLVVTAISLSATVWNLRFAPDAGVELSGYTPRTWSVRQALRGTRGLIS
jgi:EmrB/QacA subfamily drug resistance transporter